MKLRPFDTRPARERWYGDPPTYGIAPEQYRTDVPPAGPSNTVPQASVNPLGVLAIALLVLAVVVVGWLAAPVAPMPTPASREASLERQVGALSTRVVELEWRNASTLEALAGFEPVPTAVAPTWIYKGPLTSNAR